MSCSSKNMAENSENSQISTNPTTLQTIDKNRQPVNSQCVMQSVEGIKSISAPAKLQLPIAQEAPLADIVVTCTHDGQERTAILKSRMANAQSNVVVDAATGGSFVTTQLNTGNATSGFDNVSNALILGLSTNVIAGNFYIYPSLVTIEF